MTPNSDLQFIHKESGNSMTMFSQIAKCQTVATLTPVYSHGYELAILTKTDASSSFCIWFILIYFWKKFQFLWSWQNVLQLSTVLMRLFGYPYKNDLVICKDIPDYLYHMGDLIIHSQAWILFTKELKRSWREIFFMLLLFASEKYILVSASYQQNLHYITL